MKPYVPTGYILIEDAPKSLIDNDCHPTEEDYRNSRMVHMLSHVERDLGGLRAQGAQGEGEEYERYMKTTNGLLAKRRGETFSAKIKVGKFKILVEEAKNKIRDAGAAKNLKAILITGKGQDYPISHLFFKNKNFHLSFSNSEGWAMGRDRTGFGEIFKYGLVYIRIKDLRKIIESPADTMTNSMDVNNANSIEIPQPNWMELWQGPINYRRMMNNSQFIDGTQISTLINRENNGKYYIKTPKPYRFDFDNVSGALIINWELITANNETVKQSQKFYQYNICISIEAEREKPQYINNIIGNRPHNYTVEGGNALVGASNILNRIKQEFGYAVQAKNCRIFARVGSPLAEFSHIPPDVFRRYNITSWGQGVVGGGEAELKGCDNLYSIYVAPANGSEGKKDVSVFEDEVNTKLDLSCPKRKKFDEILTNIAYIMSLPKMKDKTEVDCFSMAIKDFGIPYKLSSVKNIWNGNFETSEKLGFTKEYINNNYPKN